MKGYRTVVVNLLMLAAGWLGLTLDPATAQEYAGAIITVMSLVNLVLRAVTTGPIGKAPAAPPQALPVVAALAALAVLSLTLPLSACAVSQAQTPTQQVAAAATAISILEAVNLGLQVASLASQGVASAIEARRQIETWTAEGRDPSAAELAELKAETARLVGQLRAL